MTHCAAAASPACLTVQLWAGDAAELACAACLCDVARPDATQMACGHAFCNDCWRQHLAVHIREGRSRRLLCMGVRCGAVCDEEQARAQRLHALCRRALCSHWEDLSGTCLSGCVAVHGTLQARRSGWWLNAAPNGCCETQPALLTGQGPGWRTDLCAPALLACA